MTTTNYDEEFSTSIQGKVNAISDIKDGWITLGKWTEEAIRSHIAVVIDASPEYIDAYVSELMSAQAEEYERNLEC